MNSNVPAILDWSRLDASARRAVLQRPPPARDPCVAADVARILDEVRADGDAGLRALTRRLDGCELVDFVVSEAELVTAERTLDTSVKAAIDEARDRIARFHCATAPRPLRVETAPGVACERILRPIRRVGLYVPAGGAPLPSTALMLGVPAQIAHCPQVTLCTPPRADGRCDPAVLYAAAQCGIRRVFKLGGAQAIAAMAYGTESVPACDKIFGPGNAWVSEAKRQVAAAADGVAIDMVAGPSEVLVIADMHANAQFVAADLLAQAEHGPDSQVILITDCTDLAQRTAAELSVQLATLPRAGIVRQALAHARLILVDSLMTGVAISNDYAPEHLILNVVAPRDWLCDVESAGSVFLGAWSPETVGDYCSGTNHVLPTNGRAHTSSGVSVASFLKHVTVQELSVDGLAAVAACAAALARTEGLLAHERAVMRRLAALAECE